MASINKMKQVGTQIKNATVEGENTADKVGGLLLDIIDHLEQCSGGTVTSVAIDMEGTHSPDTYGKVTLPAYPTTLPASDVSLNGRNLTVKGSTITIPDGGGGGGGGGTSLNSMLTALNAVNPVPTTSSYLQFTGSTYKWSTPSGGGGATLQEPLASINTLNANPAAETEKMLKWFNNGGTWEWGYANIPSGGGGSGLTSGSWAEYFNSMTKGSGSGTAGYLKLNNGTITWDSAPSGSGLTWSDLTSSSSNVIDRSHIPAANSNGYGGIKLGYTQSGDNQPVQVDSTGKAFVTVAGSGGSSTGGISSVGLSAPTGFSVANSPLTAAGTIDLSFATGYSLPLTDDVSKGVTAFGWGNHASEGYLKSITSAMVNSALGFTLSGTSSSTYDLNSFASSSSLNNYVQKSGDTMTGALTVNANVKVRDILYTNHNSRGLYIHNEVSNSALTATIGRHINSGNGSAFLKYYEAASASGATTDKHVANDVYVNNGVLSIGEVSLVYDSDNTALKVVGRDGTTPANIYATGGVSALGSGVSGGGAVNNLKVTSELSLGTNGYIKMSHDSNDATRMKVNAGGGVHFTVKTGQGVDITDDSCVVAEGFSIKVGNTYYDIDIDAALDAGILVQRTNN